jgi:hypothetical protein
MEWNGGKLGESKIQGIIYNFIHDTSNGQSRLDVLHVLENMRQTSRDISYVINKLALNRKKKKHGKCFLDFAMSLQLVGKPVKFSNESFLSYLHPSPVLPLLYLFHVLTLLPASPTKP